MNSNIVQKTEANWSESWLFSIVVWFHTVFKRVYTCILFKYSEGFSKIFVHYLFFNMIQVKLSMDKLLTFPWASINFCYFHTTGANIHLSFKK